MEQQLTSFRVYNKLQVFMEYRGLSLVMGSVSFEKRKKNTNSTDWLQEEDFENTIFNNNYVLVETAMESGARVFLFVFSEANPIEKDTSTLKKLIKSLPFDKSDEGTSDSSSGYIVFITRNLIDDSRKNNLSNNSPVPFYNYPYRWMLSNPFDHIAVPNMRILNDEEIEEVLDWFKRPKSAFPHMLYEDRVNMYLNAKKGDMVEISRITNTGDSISYAVIV